MTGMDSFPDCDKCLKYPGVGDGVLYRGFVRGGSTPRSNPLPFCIPQLRQKQVPFSIPFMEKRSPSHVPIKNTASLQVSEQNYR